VAAVNQILYAENEPGQSSPVLADTVHHLRANDPNPRDKKHE
jgi:hypothetical protein